MNKEQTKAALLAPDEALIALGYEGLTNDYHRKIAQAWVDSDFEYICFKHPSVTYWKESNRPVWATKVEYKLPEPEQWDCGIDFGTPCVANAKCYLVGEEFYQEAVKLIPLIKLNKLIEEKNKETGWGADWRNVNQQKRIIYFNNEILEWCTTLAHLDEYPGILPINPDCKKEVLDMLNNGLIKGIEK